ncbi:hypothetical protein [Nocardia stercoris]|uniref:ABC transporter permease n=1 Tax=Nocardia stercoris TaxID=2483361 RepID=A0A3M2L1N2_9NOCA|nr:hypothetical protein [Nocardia stercoris]RMI30413.1 hypothetical protein EBN03_22540 [Nocardia stercoris]
MNTNDFRIEWYRWIRSRRALALLVVMIFVGVTAPLLTKHLPDLIGSSSGLQVIKQPEWRDGLQGYIKQSSQLGGVICIVMVCQVCGIRRETPLGIFYFTRTESPRALYVPRMVMSLVVVTAVALAGAICALYETWASFGTLEIRPALGPLAVELCALVLFSALTAGLAAVTRSAAWGGGIAGAVWAAGLFAAAATKISPYLPTSALAPSVVSLTWTDAAKALLPLLALAVAAVVAALVRPIRYSGRARS